MTLNAMHVIVMAPRALELASYNSTALVQALISSNSCRVREIARVIEKFHAQSARPPTSLVYGETLEMYGINLT